ncbi:MAG: hypothetical protein KKB70_10255, partial [Proteobacteria bacterium]|nr:hypothetical protein [Pseudomonadota bacterium]
HLTDAPLAKIDIATMVLLALTLTKRHAAQRQTVISSTSLVNKQTISGPPMQTLLTISACLRACIDACPNGNVEISTKKARHGAEIRFSLQKREADVVADLSPESLHELGAHFSQTDNLAVLLLNP